MNDEQMVMLKQAHEAIDAAATAMYKAGGRRVEGELGVAMKRVDEAHAAVGRVVDAAGQAAAAEPAVWGTRAAEATESVEEVRPRLDAPRVEADQRTAEAIAQIDTEREALEQSALQTSEANKRAGGAGVALIGAAEQASAPTEKPKKRSGRQKKEKADA